MHIGSIVAVEGLVALWHVGTSIPCSERQILNHWTPREVPEVLCTLLRLIMHFSKMPSREEFPDYPVLRTLCFHFQGFYPWSGN